MHDNNGNKNNYLENHPRINNANGFVLLALLCISAYFILKISGGLIITGLRKLAKITSHFDAVVIVALITGAVSLIGVVISSIISKIIDYKKSRQEYLARKREKPYEAFVGMVYKLTDASKGRGEYTTDDLIMEMQRFSQELTIWGSKKVARKWVEYRTSATSYEDPKKGLEVLEDIMNEMRKDMGTGKTKRWELLKLFINDIEE